MAQPWAAAVRKMAEPVPQTILPAVRRVKSKSTPAKSGLDQRLLRAPLKPMAGLLTSPLTCYLTMALVGLGV